VSPELRNSELGNVSPEPPRCVPGTPEDYAAFLDLMEQASGRLPMRLLAWCLTANHFHLVVWPHRDGDYEVRKTFVPTPRSAYRGRSIAKSTSKRA
jgi:hypothetical protein